VEMLPSLGWNLHYLLPFLMYKGQLAKFTDSSYYSKSELCGGAVMVSFLKYLPWQMMHLLQCSTHFSKTCCRLFITSKLLASEFPFHGWKSPEITRGEILTVWWMFEWGSTDPLFLSQTQNSTQWPLYISGFQDWYEST
jgi:hypothetical protein